MNQETGQRRLMLQYLLGELSASEVAELEDAYLKDNDVFQELVAVENELIDHYILGELSSSERERFERSFLANPARRETVETAKALLAHSAANSAVSSQASTAQRGKWNVSRRIQATAAAVFLIMLGGLCWLLEANHRLGNQLSVLEQEKAATLQNQRSLQQQVEALQAQSQQRDNMMQQMAQLPADVASFTLGPGLSRGSGETQDLVIPVHAAYVVLHIMMNGEPKHHYSVFLRNSENTLIWHKDNLESNTPSSPNATIRPIIVMLPAHLLQNGDYVMKVSTGSEDLQHALAGYGFHVVR